jgi:DNA-binding NtrC family response regulator
MRISFATFTEFMPVLANDGSMTSPNVRRTIQRIRAKKLKIAVVEDHPDNLELLVKTLSKTYGAVVQPFEAAEPALKWLRSDDSFHLVLLDIGLPGVSGIDACQEIQSRGTKGRLALMTGYDDVQYAKQAQALKVPLLRKPIDSDELRQILLQCRDDA